MPIKFYLHVVPTYIWGRFKDLKFIKSETKYSDSGFENSSLPGILNRLVKS
jgi:hypothetical protein